MEENRNLKILGGIVLGLGVLFLLGNIFEIDAGALCWPVFLIGIGILVLVRPSLAGPGKDVHFKLLGDIRRNGVWTVTNGEYWIGLGDLDLDLTRAAVPPGVTTLRLYRFLGDLDLIVPPGLDLTVVSTGLINTIKSERGKEEAFLNSLTYHQPGSGLGASLRIEALAFISEVKIRHAGS